MDYNIKNVKVHFHISVQSGVDFNNHPHSCVSTKKHINFITIRLGRRVTYTVFPESGHVNATGIKDFDSIEHEVNNFTSTYNLPPIPLSAISIDNSTATGRIKSACRIQFPPLVRTAQNTELKYVINIRIRPHYFPAALIRPVRRTVPTTYFPATIVLFANGKFNILGASSRGQVNNSIDVLNSLLHHQQHEQQHEPQLC